MQAQESQMIVALSWEVKDLGLHPYKLGEEKEGGDKPRFSTLWLSVWITRACTDITMSLWKADLSTQV